MKGVFGLVATLAVVVFIFSSYLSHEAIKDQGHLLAVAFGVPAQETMQMHVAVGPRVAIVDPPELNENSMPLWAEWRNAHYQLFDASGERIPLSKMGTSGLMLGKAAAGAPDFVLWAPLTIGEEYSLDFIPIVAERKRYRYTFTVPSTAQDVARKTFELVPDEQS